MHIVFDARLYGLEHAGIGRYVKNLLPALWHGDKKNHYTILLRRRYFKTLSVPLNVSKVLLDIRHYSLAEQFKVINVVRRLKADVVHIPHFNVPLLLSQPFIVTIHDILWHQVKGYTVTTLPAALYKLKYFGYRLTVRTAVSRARQIIVPSHFVKTQLVTTYPFFNPALCTVVPEAVDPAFLITAKNHPTTLFSRQYPYVVYTGSLYPHKNIVVVLDALRLLLSEKIPIHLYIVSGRDIFLERTHDQVVARNLLTYVHFLGFIKDNELVTLYKKAVALVQPSTSEGFGLTGLEAMACSVPVIAASAGAMPEVYQNNALYFEPQDPQGLATNIKRLMTDQDLKQSLIKSGHQHVNHFSWHQAALETLILYKKAAVADLPLWL